MLFQKSVKTHHNKPLVWDQEHEQEPATTRLGPKSMKIEEDRSFARNEDSLYRELSSLLLDADVVEKITTFIKGAFVTKFCKPRDGTQ